MRVTVAWQRPSPAWADVHVGVHADADELRDDPAQCAHRRERQMHGMEDDRGAVAVQAEYAPDIDVGAGAASRVQVLLDGDRHPVAAEFDRLSNRSLAAG